MPGPECPPEPWNSFLKDLDSELTQEVQLYCAGGFAVSLRYGLHRNTNDIDCVSIVPNAQANTILVIAGEKSRLAKKHKVYLHQAMVATLPEDYESRLSPMFPGALRRIRLYALDPYDLALSKLDRNSQRDREDVKYLGKTIPLQREILEERYWREYRPNYVAGPEEKIDAHFKLWLDMLYEG